MLPKPEDKYNFTPESLKIPGSDYKGMFTFAGQIKHVTAGNYFIRSTVKGDKLDERLFNDGRGPDNLKTKAEIIQAPEGPRASAWRRSLSRRHTTTTDRWWNVCG
jgi:hypothetical protein